ncbi:hypothetical protein HPB48_010432 [Haemaphysalis longicornis]|uniref:Uncharacterized protein n=1 Tax=Haemaphysalis longicornis TaxID=44386 RepID=A0A9J6GRW2_HAELO|nr:hypothetical protein HPB48_010432 [Haemaphysalis longicornis]
MLDVMVAEASGNNDGTEQFTQRAEEGRQVARLSNRNQPRYDDSRYNQRHRLPDFQQRDMV